MKGKGKKRGGACDTEMKKDLVVRMAWESGFVKTAQNFPERGTPFVHYSQKLVHILFTKKIQFIHNVFLDIPPRKPYNYTCQGTTSTAGADSTKPSRAYIEK